MVWLPDEITRYIYWGYVVCKKLFGVNKKIDKVVCNMFKLYNVSENNLSDELNKYYALGAYNLYTLIHFLFVLYICLFYSF